MLRPFRSDGNLRAPIQPPALTRNEKLPRFSRFQRPPRGKIRLLAVAAATLGAKRGNPGNRHPHRLSKVAATDQTGGIGNSHL